MSNCQGCGYLIPKESTCPNCSHSNQDDSENNGGDVDVIEEFASRRAMHHRNTTIVMCVKMFVGMLGLLGSCGAVFGRMGRSIARSQNRLEVRGNEVEGNYEAMVIIGVIFVVLFICGVIYHWLNENADSLVPVALCCPGCNERLDELGLDYDKCPACFVQLT